MPEHADTGLDVRDGAITRLEGGPGSRAAGWLRRVGAMRRVIDSQPVRHIVSALTMGRLVRQTPRFIANELRGSGGLRSYTLRGDGREVILRHRTVDTWTFNELFVLRLYEPPEPVAAMLAERSEPVLLDLGANIGMFGLDALQRYPGALITAYEPDAESASIHRLLISRNSTDSRWRLVEACAGARTGSVSFLPGQETGSHVVDEPVPGAVTVPMEDVLPAFAGADLVKIDIEGAEWPLLADARFASARAVVLEYHRPGCPEADPHAAARRRLEGYGYEVLPLFEHPDGFGMVWAIRAELRQHP